jgi:hypothetical protein
MPPSPQVQTIQVAEQIPALVMIILRAMTARDPSPGKIPAPIWRTGAIRASLVRVAAQ